MGLKRGSEEKSSRSKTETLKRTYHSVQLRVGFTHSLPIVAINNKDETLKIVPVVVEGPWVVKSVVGGKPAILGTKLPVNYIYQKEENGKALYLEADLDIVASSAARGILSMVRSYTQILTLDLGFVVQGNSKDELPEQMLVGARLHGIDPLNAPTYPSTGADIFKSLAASDTDGDD